MAFQIAALTALLLFYGCYFIKMFCQKKKGIQTDQIGKGKTGFVKWVEIIMKFASCLAPAVELGSILCNTTCLPLSVRMLGACFSFAGVVFFILSVLTMRDSWRAGVSKTDQTELVTWGIYQISRNPAFLGFDLLYLGILLMFFNWVLFAVSMFAMLMFHLQIVNVEEDFLLAAFGEAYLDYRRQVNRYIGRKR